MDAINLETAEIIRIAVVAVILLGGLALLRFALKLTAKILTIGCLGVALVLGALVALSLFN